MSRILVVDDERHTNLLASEYLRLAGFAVTQCYDGESALETLATDNAFDLILLDKRMPGIGGLEVCRRLKEDPRTREIPIILLSAGIQPGKAAAPEAVASLAKPFSPKELVAAIKQVLP